jgi:hypothetical protein
LILLSDQFWLWLEGWERERDTGGEKSRKKTDRQPRVVIRQALSRDLHLDISKFQLSNRVFFDSSIHVRIFFSRWVLRVWTAFSCQVP